MNFNLERNTILLTLTGSRAYGTSTENSDWDYKGICIAPREYYFGVDKFEQYEGKLADKFTSHKFPDNHEAVIYDLRKYIHLAIQANPNILELLFSTEYIRHHSVIQYLMDNRNLFLTKKCRYSYAGYAHSQLMRIRTHRQWLLNPPTRLPTRKEFGLPYNYTIDHNQLQAASSLIDKQIEQWTIHPEEEIPVTVLSRARESIINLIATLLQHKEDEVETDLVLAAGDKLCFDSNFTYVVAMEKKYKAACDRWKQFQEWKSNRNSVRAGLEAKFGFDTKHASHLVRLYRTCEELLSTGQLIVHRPDREELLSIRNGAWTYDQLESWASSIETRIDKLYESSTLPHHPDIESINRILLDLYSRWY